MCELEDSGSRCIEVMDILRTAHEDFHTLGTQIQVQKVVDRSRSTSPSQPVQPVAWKVSLKAVNSPRSDHNVEWPAEDATDSETGDDVGM